MRRLLVGFDSAWTRENTGAIIGALIDSTGGIRDLGAPRLVKYAAAREVICCWQSEHAPSSTLVLLDQPTIVANETGQRPVERLVCSAVGRRRGGMQPANRGRTEMFGTGAPIWEFLSQCGATTDPFSARTAIQVLETYPVLTMISLKWTLPDAERAVGRLAKYNPERRGTFSLKDWIHVCRKVATSLRGAGATEAAAWCEESADNQRPTKSDQDRLDACICLVTALHIAQGGDGVFVGNCTTGYIVVPDSAPLRDELEIRCCELGLVPSEWIRVFRLPTATTGSR